MVSFVVLWRPPSHWALVFAATLLVLLLPTILVWVAVGTTFAQILWAPSGDAAWATFRGNSAWVAHRSGLFAPRISVHPAARLLIQSGRPAVYVLNHFPVALLDTVTIPLLGLPRCKILAACKGMPAIGPAYEKLGSICVRPGGGNTERVLAEAKKAMAEGYSLVIFGEGRHAGRKGRWDEVVDMQLGSFLIAIQEHCPVVPVALCDPLAAYGITHPATLLAPLFPSLAQTFTIRILQPIHPTPAHPRVPVHRDPGCLDKQGQPILVHGGVGKHGGVAKQVPGKGDAAVAMRLRDQTVAALNQALRQ